MKITILCVGKIKESYFTDAVAEYKKRLGRYGTVEIIEVDDEKTQEGASDREQALIREKEGERLMAKLPDDAYVIALAIGGREYTSVEFSDLIGKLGVDGYSHIAFIIGGSIGLSEEVLGSADERLSFSRMTFPHQLMRVILLEQIYRGFRILRGEPYHK